MSRSQRSDLRLAGPTLGRCVINLLVTITPPGAGLSSGDDCFNLPTQSLSTLNQCEPSHTIVTRIKYLF